MIGRYALMWTMTALVVSLIPHVPRLPLWFTPLLLAVLAYRLGSAWRGWRPLPMLIRFMLTAGAIAGVVLHYGSIFGRDAGIALLALMLALKITETYKRRDALLVTSLCYFVVIAHFLFSQSLTSVPYLAATVVVITASLLQLSSTPVGTGQRELDWDWRRWVKQSGLLLIQAAPLMLIMFLLFPRLSSPLWGMPSASEETRTGLSNEMSPGSIVDLFIDDSPAFRVRFDDAMPPKNLWYWRGPVLWNYDGRTWRGDRSLTREKLAQHPPQDGLEYSYQVELEPTNRHWLLTLDYPLQVPGDAHLSVGHQLLSKDPINSLKVYDVVSIPAYSHPDELTPKERQNALQLPDGFNPRSAEMMQQWRQETPGPRALVNRVLRWFNQEEFQYSFTPPLLGRHAVDDFIFSSRNGYCEHYASSFTAMMRMAGIPARVVTGYQGGYANELGDYLLVRQSDAHAWSEVWFEDAGWTRIDPTAAVAPERIDLGSRNAILQRRGILDYAWVMQLRNTFDTLSALWNEWVVNFDSTSQKQLFNPFGLRDIDSRQLSLIMVSVLALAALIAMAGLLRKPRQRADDATRAISPLLRSLRRKGYRRDPSEPLQLYLARVARDLPDHANALQKIALLYENARYAREPNVEAIPDLIQWVTRWQQTQ